MRAFSAVCLITALAGGPAVAQSTAGQVVATTVPKAHWTRSGETPVDHGPYTAAANRAYEGGGMILQGAPGAPPPQPEPTPPGQTPRNMVPQ